MQYCSKRSLYQLIGCIVKEIPTKINVVYYDKLIQITAGRRREISGSWKWRKDTAAGMPEVHSPVAILSQMSRGLDLRAQYCHGDLGHNLLLFQTGHCVF